MSHQEKQKTRPETSLCSCWRQVSFMPLAQLLQSLHSHLQVWTALLPFLGLQIQGIGQMAVMLC